MNDGRARLERLLGGEDLASLRKRLRQRYELGRSNDAFTVTDISNAERRALEGLLGKAAREAKSIRLSIAELDEALARAGLATSLRDALALLDGPIHHRAAERAAKSARWETAFAACTTAQLAEVVADNAGRGLVKRLAADNPDRGALLLQDAARVIDRLPQPGAPLSRLAAKALGDAHGLDEGKPVGTLVLAALRQADGERPREVWARNGVLVGELSSPALLLNLEAQRDTPGGLLIDDARMHGEPFHLSLRVLVRAPPRWSVNGRTIHVCENPAVVAMAADKFGTQAAPLVCTDGVPAAAQRALLSQLKDAGARLLYHGDFDWPGIVIANFVMRAFGAQPWRFYAADYTSHATHTGRKLTDAIVIAEWDPALSRQMCECGYALEEEAVIDTLLEDLAVP